MNAPLAYIEAEFAIPKAELAYVPAAAPLAAVLAAANAPLAYIAAEFAI